MVDAWIVRPELKKIQERLSAVERRLAWECLGGNPRWK